MDFSGLLSKKMQEYEKILLQRKVCGVFTKIKKIFTL